MISEEFVNQPLLKPIELPESVYLDKDRSFPNYQQLFDWARSNVQYFENDHRGLLAGYVNQWQMLAEPFRRLVSLIESAKPENVGDKSFEKRLRNEIENEIGIISKGPAFLTRSFFAQVINSSNVREWRLVGFLFASVGLDIDFSKSENIQWIHNSAYQNEIATGFSLAQLLGLASNSAVSPDRTHLESLSRDLASTIKNAKAAITRVSNSTAEWEKQRKLSAQTTDTEVRERIKEGLTAYRDLIDDLGVKLEGHETAFKERMRLDAPASYWSNHAKSAAKGAALWGAIFTSLVLLLLLVLITMSEPYFRFVASIGSASDNADAIAIQSFAQLALISLPAGLVFWFLRMPARLFRERLHLWNDARHREMLITTYLSLSVEGEGVITPQERAIVLQTIFSTPSDLKDEEERQSLFPIAGGTR